MTLRAASVGSNDEINFSPMGQGLGGSGSPRGSLSVATSLPDSVDLDNLVGPGAFEQMLKYQGWSSVAASMPDAKALRRGCMRPQPPVTAS